VKTVAYELHFSPCTCRII